MAATRGARCTATPAPIRKETAPRSGEGGGAAVDMGLASVLERAPLAEVLPLVRRG